MTKLILILASFLILSSCFNKQHEIQSIKIIGDKPNLNNKIEVCLKEGIGYSNCTLKMNFVFSNNESFKSQYTLISQGNSDKKCFEFYINTFSHRHSTKEERDLIEQIYAGNVKSLEVELSDDKGNKMFSKYIENL